jgi:hypothetical protein
MANNPDATETETTNMTRPQLGEYVRKELQDSSVKSVQVYKKGDKEFTRSWLIDVDRTGHNIVEL